MLDRKDSHPEADRRCSALLSRNSQLHTTATTCAIRQCPARSLESRAPRRPHLGIPIEREQPSIPSANKSVATDAGISAASRIPAVKIGASFWSMN